MSYTYLQEQEGESSAECFSDIEQFVQLKLNPTADKSSYNGKRTESCRGSRSGTISKPLTGNLGGGLQTSCAAASPVKTSAQPEKALALKVNDQAFGVKWQEWLATLDPDTSLWKTRQCSLFVDSEPSLEIWPRWGMMQNGVCWELKPWVFHISEKGSGLLPTPTAGDWKHTGTQEAAERYKKSGHQLKHTVLIQSYGYNPPHPNITEAMMAIPIGWTGLKPLEMDKFQQWQQRHGVF